MNRIYLSGARLHAGLRRYAKQSACPRSFLNLSVFRFSYFFVLGSLFPSLCREKILQNSRRVLLRSGDTGVDINFLKIVDGRRGGATRKLSRAVLSIVARELVKDRGT